MYGGKKVMKFIKWLFNYKEVDVEAEIPRTSRRIQVLKGKHNE